jgi:hypothetical protein
MPDLQARPTRGRDAKKMEKGWEERVPIWTWNNGWTLEEIRTDKDLEIEGQFMHHCGGADGHKKWVKLGWEHFWSLREPDGTPHCTVFCKLASAYGQRHPEDTGELFPRSAAYDYYGVDDYRKREDAGYGWYPVIKPEGKEPLKVIQLASRGGGKYTEMIYEWFETVEYKGRVKKLAV